MSNQGTKGMLHAVGRVETLSWDSLQAAVSPSGNTKQVQSIQHS